MNLKTIFEQAKKAGRSLAALDEKEINCILNDTADEIEKQADRILAENAKDLERMDKENPMYDRLKLTEGRIEGIAGDMRNVAKLASPLGRTLMERTLPNGLKLKKVSVPFGVIGIVYEARPNVTFDVFSLCLKSGSACVLKGGKDADCSNREAVALIKEVLRRHNVDEHTIMLHANGYIDVVIPRGSSRLIKFVRDEASVPVIETGAGVCHAYFDKDGDLEKGKAIINNAKTRRVSVCNALDCTIINAERLTDLPALCEPLIASNVLIYADAPAINVLKGKYPEELLKEATEESYGTEFQSYTMAIKTVKDAEEAMEHIAGHGSGHSECIITENDDTAEKFLKNVDAACVYVNAPTSFTDGAQFGLGAEIGISTQKLHARGPMGLEEITTYKWTIRGNGQTRPK